jgi:hypothetical protein
MIILPVAASGGAVRILSIFFVLLLILLCFVFLIFLLVIHQLHLMILCGYNDFVLCIEILFRIFEIKVIRAEDMTFSLSFVLWHL